MSKKGAKSQSQNKEQTYEVRDIVLAKVRGFPPWPGMIVDPDTVPEAVAKERPNAKTKKGNWYCVRFFPAGDYAWIVPKDISRLQQHEIEAYIAEPFKRSGDLLKGYRIALDPKAWEAEKDAAVAEAQEEEANAEVDQLESDGEEEPDDDEDKKKKTTKKRKRDSDAAPAKSKAKAKKASAEPANKAKATPAKGKKNGPKSKALVESEDEGAAEGENEGASKRTSPPPAKKAKRDKEDDVDPALLNDPEALKVREWRHKLQKAFLNQKAVPKEEEMPALDQLFSTVENYPNMTMEYLLFSKIGKVMRHIHVLSDDKVPRDDEFKFRERAKVLVDKWHDILKTNGAPDVAKPATNGNRKAADTEDAVTANGKAEEAKENGTKADKDDAMKTDDASPANGAGDESILADVTMSEAA
ncbi:hypothetical protein BD311DRAFT_552860 [Dichomitus squalens]|uniref:PWWP domain-containing protein n=1 Tax=Dichomitus squalens TaxID=114155 RepID=A0A4Q9MBV7_9APHY|nr:hypothetical protein BD311DRAFT_552860 [Dichomitus squalens]